ncbi:MAG: hypothetical protein ACR2QF_03035 [Geminicoccaceae bacterium]
MPDTNQPLIYGASMRVQELFRAVYDRLEILEQVVPLHVVAAGGSMGLTGTRAGSDIGAGWQPIDNFNAEFQTGRGVVFDLLAGTFVIDTDLVGKWDVDLQVAVEFNSTGQSRSTQLRLFDVTGGVQLGDALTISTSSQDDSLTTFVSLKREINVPAGSAIRLEIGNGSTYTGVVWNSQVITPVYRDRLTALIDPINN